MLRIPAVTGHSMVYHLLSDLISQQKKGLSLLRMTACCPQLVMKPMSTQISLPRHPVPPLQDTLKKYIRSIKPLVTQSELQTTESVAKSFEEGDGKKLQKLLEERAKKTESWLADYWIKAAYLAYRLPVVVHSNPALVFPRQKFQSQEEFIRYAADLTFASLTYMENIYKDKIPVDKMGKDPLDMTQYKRIYGTCRIPAPDCDTMHYMDASCPVKYIVVAHNNHFFKVPVYDTNGEILCPEVISKQLLKVVTESPNQTDPIGIFTTEHRDTWAKVYNELVADGKNCNSVNTIHEALFLVCLDGPASNIPAPDFQTLTALKIIHGGGSKFSSGNRWFDKTIQIVVGCEGEVGINVEHSPAEAVPVAMLMNFCLDFMPTIPQNKTAGGSFPQPEKLEFNVTPNLQKAIKVAECNLDNLVDDTEFLSCTFHGYGKNVIKEFKVSPDSYIQMALQFAYYRLHKKPAAQYESGGTRKFYLGRTDAIRSCSIESVHFAKTMLDCNCSNEEKKDALLAAIKSHKDYTVQAAFGLGVDRHLLGLKLVGLENGIEPHAFYKDPAYVRSTHFKVTTSQVAGKGNSVMCYGAVVPDGYACCYNPLGNTMNFGLSAFKSSKETDLVAFHDALMESFTDMEKVMATGHKVKSKL